MSVMILLAMIIHRLIYRKSNDHGLEPRVDGVPISIIRLCQDMSRILELLSIIQGFTYMSRL